MASCRLSLYFKTLD